MAIELTCTCGKQLTVKDEFSGCQFKCPSCQAELRVPIKIELAEPFIPPPAAERICPNCSTENPSEQESCISCGGALAPHPAGPPPPLAPPKRLLSVEKPFEKQMPFALLALGMFFRPAFVLEYLRGWLQRTSVLIQLIVFYLFSLVVLSALALMGHAGPRQPQDKSEPAAVLREPTKADPGYLLEKGPMRPDHYFDTRILPDDPRPNKPAMLRVGVYKGDKPADVKLTGTLQQKRLTLWDPAERTIGRERPPQKIVLKREGKSEWHRYEWSPPDAGDYAFVLTPEPAVGEHRIEVDVQVYPMRGQADTKGMKALTTYLRILFAIVVSVISIVIGSAAINVASKLLGGGGEFIYLMVVLAFVESIINVGSLVLIPIVPMIGEELAILPVWAFGIWQLGLNILAVMKVYDFDIMSALMTCLIAFAIKMWAAAAIVLSMFHFIGWL